MLIQSLQYYLHSWQRRPVRSKVAFLRYYVVLTVILCKQFPDNR